MNGVYCQVSTATIVEHRVVGVPRDRGDADQTRAQLTIPPSELSSDHFQISAAAAGMTRNGVISRVRATDRPTNSRSISTASSRPRISDSSTEPPTITMVDSRLGRK